MNTTDPQHTAPVPPAADRAALRDRIAAAIWERQNPGRRWADCEHPWGADAEEDADAVLSVLPASNDRGAALREAADRLDRTDLPEIHVDMFDNGARWVTAELRRMADETPQPDTQAERRETVEFLTQTQQPDGTWEFSSGTTRALEAAASIQASLRRRFPETGHRLAQRTTTVVVQLLADCPACGAGIEHDVHCPTPETHNAGCGCPSEDAPEHMFGGENCDCIPFTRQEDPPRYLNRPTDTVDMISGWETGSSCPHHKAAVVAPPVHVGGNVNAEDCPACTGTNPPYPFICPGPAAASAQPAKEAESWHRTGGFDQHDDYRTDELPAEDPS